MRDSALILLRAAPASAGIVARLSHNYRFQGAIATLATAIRTCYVLVMAWIVVALQIIGVLPTVIDGLEQIGFTVGKAKINLWMLLQGALTVMVTMLVAMWAAGVLESRLMRTEGLDSNLQLVFARLSKALLLVLTAWMKNPLQLVASFRADWRWLAASVLLMLWSLYALAHVSDFLYFQF